MSSARRRHLHPGTGTPSSGNVVGKRCPYGLDVWHGPEAAKVLRVLWADNGSVEVVTFIGGSWEQEVLGLRVQG
jgi:hypothetical protein